MKRYIRMAFGILFLFLFVAMFAAGIMNISDEDLATAMIVSGTLLFGLPSFFLFKPFLFQKNKSIQKIEIEQSEIEELKNEVGKLKEENQNLQNKCNEIEAMQDKVDELKSSIELLNKNKENCEAEYNEILNKKSSLIDSYKHEAMQNSEKTLQKLDQDISIKKITLKELEAKYDESRANIESNAKKVIKLKEIYKSFQYAIKAYENGSDSRLNEALITQADEMLEPIVEMKLNCLNVKQLKARYTQEQRNIQEAFRRYESRYTTKANIAIYKLMVIALEAELQNVLYSLKFGKLEDSIEAIKEITSRYLTIAVDGNQSIAPTMKKFIGEIEYLFIEAVKIEYEYYTQKERIKEEQRALREQMRQEAEERKALEQQRKQIEKEESKYKSEIDSVNEQINNCIDEKQIEKLQERILQLQQQLDAVNDKKEEIANLQNGKAGYVYVISNLGSFGENVFKVGMTRRLEPMDRVKELGDASVPFSFDVHSFIFSDDAVSLEKALHNELNSKRVNKINMRKEFFRVSIDEIEGLVYKYEPTAEFNRTMLAEQYYQGLSLDNDELQEIPDNELIMA